ncbi:MAG: glutaredoxin family protein [Gammaproteobacteria bacterium]
MSRLLTLYYRTGCHLCEQMLAEIYALHGEDVQIRLVDVDGDATLKDRYSQQVPVLMGGEVVLSIGRLDRGGLEEYLTSAKT